MTEPGRSAAGDGATGPGTSPPSPHADHDVLLVAAAAAGDDGDDAAVGARLVATCPECAVLHDELAAIAAATRGLPAPARPRDFRLTPEQARAHRPQAWRRLLLPFASTSGRARPVGALLVTVGLAGVLLGLLPGSPGDTLSNIAGGIDVGGQLRPVGPVSPAASVGDGEIAVPAPPASAGSLALGPSPTPAAPCASQDIVLGPLACTPGGGGETAAGAASPPGALASPGDTAGSDREDAASRFARSDRPILVLSTLALVVGVVLLGLVGLARWLRVEGGT